MEEESIKSVLRRLANLETHLLNFAIPFNQLLDILTNTKKLDDLIKLLKEPIKIDDRKLSILMQDFQNIYLKFSEDLEKMDLSQTFGEIKYIGHRLRNIEIDIQELKDQKRKQKFKLNLEIDGDDVHVIPEIDRKINENSTMKPKSRTKPLKTSIKSKRPL